MVFSSVAFLFLFLPISIVVYFFVREELRNYWLLLASLLFYAWGEGIYILIMLFSIGVNYCFGLFLSQSSRARTRKIAVTFAIITNIGLLGWFKYSNFLIDNINGVLSSFDIAIFPLETVHLPIGISFFTFQAISYILDVYREEVPVQKSPFRVALYISLFPQLIAGPIVRYISIADQLGKRRISVDRFSAGIQRFVIGLGKKVLIANVLAEPIDRIFALPSEYLGFGTAWLAIVGYSLQIYFDFSGYSDMAVGLGLMFGFRYPENFNFPYIAQSIQEFWRRWHMTLSSWFRDYVYIPLGGNRKGRRRTYINLWTVFFLTGLWHGASWSFVIWGLFHGSFLIIERMGFNKMLGSLWRPFRHFYVMAVVLIGWVFFRVDSIYESGPFIGKLLGYGVLVENFYPVEQFLNQKVILALILGIIASMPTAHFWNNLLCKRELKPGFLMSQVTLKEVFLVMWLVAILFLSVLSIASGTYNPFIYFRF